MNAEQQTNSAPKLRAHARKLMFPSPESFARRVCRRHRTQGGSSQKLADLAPDGLAPKSGFMVSVKGHEEILIGRDIRPEHVLAYVARHQSPLVAGLHLGTWYNAEANASFLDVSCWCLTREDALAAGKRWEQLSVWDCAARVAVPVE